MDRLRDIKLPAPPIDGRSSNEADATARRRSLEECVVLALTGGRTAPFVKEGDDSVLAVGRSTMLIIGKQNGVTFSEDARPLGLDKEDPSEGEDSSLDCDTAPALEGNEDYSRSDMEFHQSVVRTLRADQGLVDTAAPVADQREVSLQFVILDIDLKHQGVKARGYRLYADGNSAWEACLTPKGVFDTDNGLPKEMRLEPVDAASTWQAAVADALAFANNSLQRELTDVTESLRVMTLPDEVR